MPAKRSVSRVLKPRPERGDSMRLPRIKQGTSLVALDTMKRNLVLSGVLLFVALNALGQSRQQARFANPLLDDVVEMSRAQLPEATILAFLRARQARLETDVTADDLIRLHRAGVSDRVVESIASISGLENRPADREREAGVTFNADG